VGNDELQRKISQMMRDKLGKMHMATHPAMNAAQGSVLGQAYQSVGQQSSIFGGAVTSGQMMAAGRSETMFDHNRQVHITVTSADNGFILSIMPEMMGTASRILVANTIEELRDLITSEMVTRKLEK